MDPDVQASTLAIDNSPKLPDLVLGRAMPVLPLNTGNDGPQSPSLRHQQYKQLISNLKDPAFPRPNFKPPDIVYQTTYPPTPPSSPAGTPSPVQHYATRPPFAATSHQSPRPSNVAATKPHHSGHITNLPRRSPSQLWLQNLRSFPQ